jgi:hypothetical protein
VAAAANADGRPWRRLLPPGAALPSLLSLLAPSVALLLLSLLLVLLAVTGDAEDAAAELLTAVLGGSTRPGVACRSWSRECAKKQHCEGCEAAHGLCHGWALSCGAINQGGPCVQP